MTTFTDDLDNDLEVLAEHHDVTPVQVAKAAFAQLPDYLRRTLLESLLEAQPKPVSEDPEPHSPHTGLPQKMRGAKHELTRNYPVKLEIDDELVRENIARAFLPKKPLREKLEAKRAEKATSVRTELMERATGKMLHSEGGAHYGPPVLLISEGGKDVIYLADRQHPRGSIETRILPDGSKVIRNYFVKDAEQ